MEEQELNRKIELLEKRVKSLLERMNCVEFELKLYKQWMVQTDQDISFFYELNTKNADKGD